jgi:hypothetical protein
MPDTNETMLEQTFSSLAFSTLRDRASSLLDYLVGFQMLKNEGDGRRAVGIFGFEIDDKVYYAPVFFLNGEIRGMESLYSVDSDLFVPLTESWVNSVINKQNLRVGEPDNRSTNERGIRIPNYMRLKVIPSSNGGVNLKIAEAMLGAHESDGVIDTPTALSMACATHHFKEAMEKNPRLREAFEQYYNWADLTDNVKKAAEEKKTEKPVVVITSATDAGTEDLTDKQREDIMAGGVAVIDKRPEVSKSILYTTETKQRLENPTEGPGLYDVLWSDGSVCPAIIVTNSDNMPNQVLVVRIEDGKHCVIDSHKILVVRQYNATEYADKIKEMGKKPSDIVPGDVVAFLSFNGTGTSGYCIREKISGLDGSTVLYVNDAYYMNAQGNMFASSPMGYGQGPRTMRRGRQDPNQRVEQIIITPNGSPTLVFVGNKLVVNDKGAVAVVLNKAKFDGDYGEKYADKYCDVVLSTQDFGDESTIRTELSKIAHEITVWKNDHLITIQDQYGTRALTKKAAYEQLMLTHGLNEADAAQVIDSARQFTDTYFVKTSATEFMPFPPDQLSESFGNEVDAFHPSQIPLNYRMPRTPDDNREFYTYKSPFGAGGGHEGNGVSPLNTIMEAAKSGQKEVFDASVMGSLLKSHNPTELVDRFMPTIITGMDRLGRILFLLFWHYDKFEERYGEDDLSELIDNLQSSFDDLGEIVLFLKKRSLSGDPDHFGIGIGETSIEDQ